uniref:EF-hand domain-containing protein n=1 Tax=Chromera velia CCMP2878 TaxID=1169474 RepID=A0A0K6S760_9ALVE|eukprot:Cvel_19742.t2-p1 / transcript=Cvel_19742.t2 / gene=Cvel_19742 / organism=Chromera_velia_CCMP2878 / gene_product=hypothetical protein / transcript_product=hypothetical protein / location=Cvel_scaffold1727:32692-37947(-) / protein_length=686 / sequence_SO=supercontig / SO=protein_coding / is_pseudo=false
MSFFLRRNHVVFRPDGPFYFQKGCLEKRKAFGKRKTGAAVLGIPQDTEWKLLAIFSHADTNDDGFVSDADLHGMVGSVCCAEGDEAIFHITATVYRTAKSAISDLMNRNEEEKEDTADAKAPTGPSLDFEVSIADDGVASDVEEGMGVSWQIDFDAFLEGAVASAPFGEALKRLFEHFDRRCGRAGKKPGGRTADFEKDMVRIEDSLCFAFALARAVLRQQFPEQREFRFEEILAFLSAWMQASRPHWLSVSHQRSLEDFFSAIDGFHKDNMKPFKKREREKEKDAGDLLQLQLQQKEKEREQQAKEESLRADTERTKLGAASASLADQGVKGGQGKDLQKSGLVVLQKEKEKEDENSDRHAASLDLHGVAYFLDLIGIKKPWVQAALLIARTQAVRQAVLSWNDQETEIVEGRWALHDEAVDNAIEGSAEVAGKEVVDLWSGKGRITSKDLVMAARVSSRRILAADNKAPPVFILGLAGKVAKQFGEMYQLLQSSDRQLCPLLRSDSLQAVCDLLEVPTDNGRAVLRAQEEVSDLAPVFFGLEARQGGLTTEAVQTGGATTGGYRDPVTLNCLHNWMTTFAPRLTDGQFEDDDEHLDGGAMSPGRNRSLGVGVGSSGSAPSKFSFSFWEFSTATRSGSQALRVVTALWTAFEAAARQEEREENPFAQPKYVCLICSASIWYFVLQ